MKIGDHLVKIARDRCEALSEVIAACHPEDWRKREMLQKNLREAEVVYQFRREMNDAETALTRKG